MSVTASRNTTLYAKEGEAQTPLNPSTVAEQVAMNSETGTASNVSAEIIALRQNISSLTSGGGVSFKGALTSAVGLPTVAYKAGWQYIVQDAGTYAGKVCEEGDLIICTKDYASGSASNSDWAVIQANIVGAVTGPASSVANHVAIFDGTGGKIIKDSGYTLGTSVPADAKFSDTTYAAANGSADGLMTAALYTKLVGIEEGADKTDAANVKAAGALMSDTTTDSITEGTTNKYITSAEKTKLAGIATGAEVNQNAFSGVKVGTTTIAAGSKTDTVALEAGDGITMTADASAKKVTIAETYIDCCVVSSLDNVPANLRNGGLVIVKA